MVYNTGNQNNLTQIRGTVPKKRVNFNWGKLISPRSTMVRKYSYIECVTKTKSRCLVIYEFKEDTGQGEADDTPDESFTFLTTNGNCRESDQSSLLHLYTLLLFYYLLRRRDDLPRYTSSKHSTC